ncbi:cysteine hydrolase [Aeromicrobium panaciterrae]|uniref:cysteine hydrolase family protein n=1 Tax=Aeromicrobium panaciterrae TaxID=363861 RepID=UPI0031D16162
MAYEVEAVVLVDLQRDFFADAELARHRERVVAACNGLCARATALEVPVIEIRTVHAPDRSTWTRNMLEDGRGMVIDGTPGAERLPELECSVTAVVPKTRDSAFHGTVLEDLLKELGVSTFALCGVSTESCIAVTASDAYAYDFGVVLVEEAIASVDPDQHDRTLALLREQYRQPVGGVDDVTFRQPSASRGRSAEPGLGRVQPG